MKKRISLLLCALMLLLGVQSACASLPISNFRSQATTVNIHNSEGVIIRDYSEVFSTPCQKPVLESAAEALSGHSRPSTLSIVSKAVLTDISPKDENGYPLTKNDNEFFSVIIPMSELAPPGTLVQNVQVFHGTPSSSDAGSDSSNPDDNVEGYTWDELNAVILTEEKPEFSKAYIHYEDPNPGTSTTPPTTPLITRYEIKNGVSVNVPVSVKESSTSVCFQSNAFSPFIIVWDEVVLYSDVPQTGDASSVAPWLVLLGGACALLVLRRRLRRA